MTKVLLFSGGMDSYCMLHIVKPDVILFFDLGTEDNKRELENYNKMFADNPILFSSIRRIEIIKLNLSKWELENKIIPHRNTMLALIAANYGNEIYLGATAGDTTKDKDYVFKSQIEGMLNYFALDTMKVIEKAYPFTLNMPFKGLSKADILCRFIKENGDVKALLKYSRSCYAGSEKECGKCRACIRKWVALVLNEVDYTDIFEVEPFDNISDDDDAKFRTRPSERDDYVVAIAKVQMWRSEKDVE